MRVLSLKTIPATAASIEMMLRAERFICDTTDLGEDGSRSVNFTITDNHHSRPDAADIDGYEVLRRLRAARVARRS